MMSSKDQEQEDAIISISTTLLSRASSLSSIVTSTTIASTKTASAAKSSLKRNIRTVNDDSDNKIVSCTHQRFDDNNQSNISTKRIKYARRNSIVIQDIKQLSQIATDLSTISKN
jgi:hypothetical protein